MNTWRKTRPFTTWALVLTIAAFTGCGSSSDSDSSPTTSSGDTAPDIAPAVTHPPDTEPTPAATEPSPTPPGADIAPTSARMPLGNAYDFVGGTPPADLLPAPTGTVEAHWYRAGDVMAVVYVGLDPEVSACPGNSALTSAGFEFASNAELPNGSCPDFATRIENTAAQGVQLCEGVVSYLTLIPVDTLGNLFASLEVPVPDIGGVGLTSSVQVLDPTALPEIDPAALSC